MLEKVNAVMDTYVGFFNNKTAGAVITGLLAGGTAALILQRRLINQLYSDMNQMDNSMVDVLMNLHELKGYEEGYTDCSKNRAVRKNYKEDYHRG